MIPAYTGTQVREAEKPLLEAGRGPELMRRAAHGLAQHTLELLRAERGRVYGTRVVALVGTGNNGGDALYALAQLARRGVAATAVLMGETAHEGGLVALGRAGGRVASLRKSSARRSVGATGYEQDLAAADVVIDAVFGTGARGGVRLPKLPVGALVVACDLPSGVNADTGDAPAGAPRADLTVTFGALKTGLVVGRGHLLAGRIEVVDIGLGPHLPAPELRVMDQGSAQSLRPRPAPEDHKYTRGVLGLVAGSEQYPGAALLTAAAAVNTGLGMLRYVAPNSVARQLVAAVPEAVRADDGGAHVQAWTVGPGIGEDEDQIAHARMAMDSGLPCVVDASALPLLGPGQQTGKLVLTPHAGELVDLLVRTGIRTDRSRVEADPVRWARWAAVGYGAIVLLKGPSTVVAAPDGYAVVVNNGSPSLATAGSGDVLAGMVGAYLATGGKTGTGRGQVDVVAAAAAAHAASGSVRASGMVASR